MNEATRYRPRGPRWELGVFGGGGPAAHGCCLEGTGSRSKASSGAVATTSAHDYTDSFGWLFSPHEVTRTPQLQLCDFSGHIDAAEGSVNVGRLQRPDAGFGPHFGALPSSGTGPHLLARPRSTGGHGHNRVVSQAAGSCASPLWF